MIKAKEVKEQTFCYRRMLDMVITIFEVSLHRIKCGLEDNVQIVYR
jgi:hypothetical protein